jgi:hypothetical protein
MKVLYVGLARSIWLFDLGLMNPKGVSLQGLIDLLKEKYRFAKAPKNALDLDEQKALSFRSGTFTNSKGIPVIVGFSIYNDGFTAETLSSTDDSTEFLLELAGWMKVECGFSLPEDVRKAYVGQIDFESEGSLLGLNTGLTNFLKALEARYSPVDKKPRQFDAAGLSFWTEDVNKPTSPAIFKFERKMGAPFSSNHYFSQAPLETQSHIEVLQELETLLKK